MTERQLLELWGKVRLYIGLSQIAPTFLLIVMAIAMGLALTQTDIALRAAVLGILLAVARTSSRQVALLFFISL